MSVTCRELSTSVPERSRARSSGRARPPRRGQAARPHRSVAGAIEYAAAGKRPSTSIDLRIGEVVGLDRDIEVAGDPRDLLELIDVRQSAADPPGRSSRKSGDDVRTGTRDPAEARRGLSRRPAAAGWRPGHRSSASGRAEPRILAPRAAALERSRAASAPARAAVRPGARRPGPRPETSESAGEPAVSASTIGDQPIPTSRRRPNPRIIGIGQSSRTTNPAAVASVRVPMTGPPAAAASTAARAVERDLRLSSLKRAWNWIA